MTHQFTYRDLFAFGWEKTKKHFWSLLLIFTIMAVVSAGAGIIPPVGAFVSMLVSIAVLSLLLRIAHGHAPTYHDLVRPFDDYKVTLHYFLAILAVSLPLIVIVMALGALTVFLAVTGSIFAAVLIPLIFGLALVYVIMRIQFFKLYIVEHKEAGPIEAILRSWSMTHGKFWMLAGFTLAMLLINLGGLLALGIGLFLTIPTTSIAHTLLYTKLAGHHEG
jgi:hypothetical protein